MQSAQRVTVHLQRQVSDSYTDHPDDLGGQQRGVGQHFGSRKGAKSTERSRKQQEDGQNGTLTATDRAGGQHQIINLTAGPQDPGAGNAVSSHRVGGHIAGRNGHQNNIMSGYMNNFTVESSGNP